MTQAEMKLCLDLEKRYEWVYGQLSTRYGTDERYGESCFVADGKKIEAFMIHKLVFPEKSHALVIEYAFKGDGFFSEDGELYPIEDYPDREQMLKDMISEIES